MSKLTTENLKKSRIICLYLGLLALLFLAFLQVAAAGSDSKNDMTPTFCQRDPEAGFANDGRMYCAPVSFSNGLIYLALARGMTDLVDGTDHDAQMALIHKLAEEMDTDEKIGTGPNKILTGLRSYVESIGYGFKRLEMAGWRSVSDDNDQYVIGKKPDLKWMREAAEDPDCVEIFNAGWYQDAEGGYSRSGGHWVTVVDAGPGDSEFQVHNPALQPDEQKSSTSVKLTLLDNQFTVVDSNDEESNMAGYYKMGGPGLPFSEEKASAAVLDTVIVFKLKK